MGSATRSGSADRSFEPARRLHAVANRFGGNRPHEKAALLEQCSAESFADVPALLAYHDTLLFMLAYPENAALLARTERELQRVATAARRISEAKNARIRGRLAGTGIAWSELTSEFSFSIAAWLAQRYPANAEIDGAGEGGLRLQSALKLCLLPIEAEFLEAEYPDVNELLDEAKGSFGGSRLEWLVGQFERLQPGALPERLFEMVQPFVRLTPRDSRLSRTFARGLEAPVFYHTGELLRHVSLAQTIAEPVPAARTLTQGERATLLDTARGVLANLGRETDAIGATTSDDIAYHELGRGLGIALYAMPPERRFPLDTHLGFMLFKNRLPIAYGGGWPFLEQCKIGVNVFGSYRGGESAYVFCQVLRVYQQRFGVERFVVEPYQFGAHNREGLLSGAFWFYYRLGFRPAGERQASLAAAEFAQIERNGKYRSPLGVMRRLTACNLELDLTEGAGAPWPDPAQLSFAATAWIRRNFKGDRAAAETAALERVRAALGVRNEASWTEGERHAFRVLSVIVAMIPDLERWSLRDRRDCVELMRAKGAQDETLYFALSRRHPRWRNALLGVLEAAESESA